MAPRQDPRPPATHLELIRAGRARCLALCADKSVAPRTRTTPAAGVALQVRVPCSARRWCVLEEFEGLSLPDFGSAYGSRAADLVRSGAFPAFGLDETWTAYRALGDVHFVNGSLDSVGLAHLTGLEEDAPMIKVHAFLEAHPETIEVLACRADLVPDPLFAPI
jgi:hypothetical protein